MRKKSSSKFILKTYLLYVIQICNSYIFQDYLQVVVKSSQSYKNLNELLYRYESLIETKDVLSEKQHLSLIALELARANMVYNSMIFTFKFLNKTLFGV